MVSQEPQGQTLSVQQSEIQELRKKLHQAELVKAIEAARALNVVLPGVNKVGPKLGPTMFAPTGVNGVTVEALVDTGSPATIVSMDLS